jgi:hypothetical protein
MRIAKLEMCSGFLEPIANYEFEGLGVGDADGAGVYEGSCTKVELGTGSVVGPIPQVACIPPNMIPVCSGTGLTKKIV